MSEEAERLALRQADQARTDFAIIETELEALHKQLAGLPTRRELARLGFIILFVGAVLGIVATEAFWRYLPVCGAP
jgi:hypothetical protein